MLQNRTCHLGNDVFLSGDDGGTFALFDKASSLPSKPFTTMNMEGASFHTSPCASFVAVITPFPSQKHYVFLPESQHTLFLRTIAPVVSCVWHPKISHLLLVLTSNDKIEVHDVLGESVSDIVPRSRVVSLQPLKDEFSASHHHKSRSLATIASGTPMSDTARESSEGSPATVASNGQLVQSKHHMPHAFSRFVHLTAVDGVTGSNPMLLLLAGDSQGHVFSVQLEDSGAFPVEGDHSPVPVFHCDTKLMPKHSHKTATCPLSVQAAMIDATRGTFAISVLRSDGVVSTGYIREKWMYNGIGHHHPVHPCAFNLFDAIDMSPRVGDVMLDAASSPPSATATPKFPSNPTPKLGSAKLGPKQLSIPGRGNTHDNALVVSPSRQHSDSPSYSGGTRTRSTMGSRTTSSQFTVPEVRSGYMEVHHSSKTENVLLLGVCPTAQDLGEEDDFKDAEESDRLRNENALKRAFALVAFPYWDESNEGWIYDPLLATRVDNHEQHEDASKSFRLPLVGKDHKTPPAPLAMRLPLDLDGYNLSLGNYTLCLEPDRALTSPPPIARSAKRTGGEMSPIFVSLNNLLASGLLAVTPWSETGPELISPFHHPEIGSKAHPIFGGVCEVMGNIMSQGYTFSELEGQLKRLHLDMNKVMREPLKQKDMELSKKQQLLKDKAQNIRVKFGELEKELDGHDVNLTSTMMARKGLPSLVAVNERLGELHNKLEEMQFALDLAREKRATRESLAAQQLSLSFSKRDSSSEAKQKKSASVENIENKQATNKPPTNKVGTVDEVPTNSFVL